MRKSISFVFGAMVFLSAPTVTCAQSGYKIELEANTYKVPHYDPDAYTRKSYAQEQYEREVERHRNDDQDRIDRYNASRCGNGWCSAK